MTPEQFDNTIDLILRHQAQFLLNQESLSNELRELSDTAKCLSAGMQNFSADLQSLTCTVQTMASGALNLVNVFQEERENVGEHRARLDKLIEIQSRRLDRLEGNSVS